MSSNAYSCPSCGATVTGNQICGCHLSTVRVNYPPHLQSGHSYGASGYPRVTVQRPWWDAYGEALTTLGKLAVRLNLKAREPMPFQYIDAYHVGPTKVFVFIVQNDQAIIIEDGELFPSDALVTQLRLLAEKK